VSVSVRVCLFEQNLKNYLLEIDAAWLEYVSRWTLEVIESWWHLTLTFDLEKYHRIFSIPVLTFGVEVQLQNIYLSTSRIKVTELMSRSRN